MARGRMPPLDWAAAAAFAGAGTRLRPGDLLVGPVASVVPDVVGAVEIEVEGIGVLSQTIA